MKKSTLLATSLATLPSAALAHVGDHDASQLMATLQHLLSSADHLLLLVIAGLVTAGVAMHRNRARITKMVQRVRQFGRSESKR